ncbi:hypothetical protein EJ06DRAFT_484439 [Trichodelitschia bisporula]|uniref:Chloride channel protein n=1 Tax=Trichodelitschia bisporula TaxID=703511 RepID=A0A6G1HIZ3_9PEZI|nr:hypothetical protein EJ06DRAFT_484439 [Trichodelitschia bisporula]
MAHHPTERTHLLYPRLHADDDARSLRSAISKEEGALAATAVGERLPYNDYTTIDWLHDLIKEAYRRRAIHGEPGIRGSLFAAFDACSGWIAVTLIGVLMALVACAVDLAVATVSDLKFGYCSLNPLLSREACCRSAGAEDEDGQCKEFTLWSTSFGPQFGIYVAWAVLFGVISSFITMFSKRSLPRSAPGHGDKHHDNPKFNLPVSSTQTGKSMYMSAGSGIPEIKTILAGFVIPHFLDLRVLFLKGIGAVFSVATGMALGKEGPFVHMAACLGHFVANLFPKYKENGKQFREILTAACASGLSAAFGAPIGGVLFAYEELSCYFPRKVLWRTFLCSMVAAMTLRALNPHKTGKLVLFETNYGTSYQPHHYLVFVLIGIAGGLWGGTFTNANYLWARWFRKHSIIRNNPVFEVFLIILVTAALQFPNPATRAPGDAIIRNLLVDCKSIGDHPSWVCDSEASPHRGTYVAWLAYGTLVQLASTTITFGLKVPAGIIIPALDGGALFGRLIGQWVAGTHISPGIFAMVGAAAFLAGVTRMTISLCVIMFELTGELEYVLPHMIAILCAKWTADLLSKESIYDLAQSVLGHPFLNADEAMELVETQGAFVEQLIPPAETMAELTIAVPPSNKVARRVLEEKLGFLERRGLMDGGVVLVQHGGVLQGYMAQNELDYGLKELGAGFGADAEVRLLGYATVEGEFDLSVFVDRAPVSICAKAPMEVAVEIFTKLGVRYLCVTEEGTGRLVGFVIKKRVLSYLDSLKHH